MRLSIIVPAYKVENYIEKCIRSLESQDIQKSAYEIIVTNDGSPDRSGEIVERLQLEFPNIILLNQENQGVSMARNNAITKAKGKYIMPIDPDDYVVENTLNALLEKAESQDLDVLYLGYEIFDNQRKSVWHTNFNDKNEIYDGVSGYFASRGNDVRDPDHSCGILFSKAMIDQYDLKYPAAVPFLEDGLFLVKVFSVANRVGFDAATFYQRTTSAGSATVSGVYYSQRAIDGFLKAATDLRDFSKKHEFSKIQQGLIHHGIANFVLLAIFPLVSATRAKIFDTMRKIKSLGFSKLEITGVVNPYLKYAKYFNISPYFFLLMYAKEMAVKKFSR
jgi:glycosyltransferase involved in cell wall biosynthesis